MVADGEEVAQSSLMVGGGGVKVICRGSILGEWWVWLAARPPWQQYRWGNGIQMGC